MKKIIIYQVLPRLFGNQNATCRHNGTLEENGCGKMSAFTPDTLSQIKALGATHVWYTGIIRHATTTDYTAYGLPKQHAQVVKGKAGSPYAITDYYDVDPDLADNVDNRLEEFEQLIARTHEAGMKVIMDFVPNHVAREYKSVMRPEGVEDLGEGDDTSVSFSQQNNFYYCPNEHLDLSALPAPAQGEEPYDEFPAKCTGNDRFDSHPQWNDWYETVKLNYGVDYMDAGGRSYHYDPVPSTWLKMTHILRYWAGKGVDGFRCDMAEMVPTAFWAFATSIIKNRYPDIIFIGEVYDQSQYRFYIRSGFDYLYDKVGMYDCVRDVICHRRPAGSLSYQWQSVDDIKDHMLYFLENHDEQRIASAFFCNDARKGVPGLMVTALLRQNPMMIYSGQEFGERGMDDEGYSGKDGRTTIFDYWCVGSVRRGFFHREEMTGEECQLEQHYRRILNIAASEKAICDGEFFDLMYVNPQSDLFNPREEYAFLRRKDEDLLLIAVNFGDEERVTNIIIPSLAFAMYGIPEKELTGTDLLTNAKVSLTFKQDGAVEVMLPPYGGCVLKFNMSTAEKRPQLNDHNKDEFPPAHTAEHLLNQIMVRMFGCERSNNAHVERRKCKISYILDHEPTRQEVKSIVDKMNELIAEDLPVTYEYVTRNNLPAGVKLDRLPKDVSETIRLVRIGDFDVCPCIGKHVRSTSQIGKFELLGTNWDATKHSFRIRFKVVP